MKCSECNDNESRASGMCSTCYSRKWRRENKERARAYQQKYYQDNKAAITDHALEWQKNNPDRYKEIRKRWSKNSEYSKKRYHSDLDFRLRVILRSRLLQSIRVDQKVGSAVEDLGCSIKEFKKYLASRFQDGMSWDNIGEWHLDHIVPLSSFDLTDRQQFLKACHYTNIQPLWKADNLKKGDTIP